MTIVDVEPSNSSRIEYAERVLSLTQVAYKPMNRVCPNCSKKRVPVSSLILSRTWCPSCGALVNVRKIHAFLFFVVTFVVTAASFVAIMAQQGIYAALIWLPLPIGALGYIKARYCPLRAKDGNIGPKPHSQDHFV